MTMVTYLISSGTVRKQVGKPEGAGRHRSISSALCLAAPQTSKCSPPYTPSLWPPPSLYSAILDLHSNPCLPLGHSPLHPQPNSTGFGQVFSEAMSGTYGAWRSFRSLLQLLFDSRNQGSGESPKGILAFSPGSLPRPMLSHPFCKTARPRWFHLQSDSQLLFLSIDTLSNESCSHDDTRFQTRSIFKLDPSSAFQNRSPFQALNSRNNMHSHSVTKIQTLMLAFRPLTKPPPLNPN